MLVFLSRDKPQNNEREMDELEHSVYTDTHTEVIHIFSMTLVRKS